MVSKKQNNTSKRHHRKAVSPPAPRSPLCPEKQSMWRVWTQLYRLLRTCDPSTPVEYSHDQTITAQREGQPSNVGKFSPEHYLSLLNVCGLKAKANHKVTLSSRNGKYDLSIPYANLVCLERIEQDILLSKSIIFHMNVQVYIPQSAFTLPYSVTDQ